MPGAKINCQDAAGRQSGNERSCSSPVIQPQREAHCVKNTTGDAKKLPERIVLAVLCSLLMLSSSTYAQQQAQTPAPKPLPQTARVTSVTVDGNEAMFTTMCALLAAGFEADVSAANWHPLRAQLRERMQHQQGP